MLGLRAPLDPFDVT